MGQKLTKIAHLEGLQRGEKLKNDFPIEGATFQKYYISKVKKSPNGDTFFELIYIAL